MKTIQLDTTQINNRRDLRLAIDALIDFKQWNGSKLNDWVDMIALGESQDPALARFKSQTRQQIVLEIVDSKKFLRREPTVFEALLVVIQRVNNRYMHKTGRPLISTILL